jgi:lipopolysaccharide export system protein LptC
MAERRRQRVVRLLKIALPLSALALIAAIFTFPRPELGDGVGFSHLDFDLRDGLQVNAPRFTGADAEGRPFTVFADWARPDRPDPERVTLGPVRGEIAIDAERRLNLTAGGGEIRPKANLLMLDDGVDLNTSEGWRLSVSRADIDLEQARLTAQGPISGDGPGGEIAAEKMRAAQGEDGYTLWFEGGVAVRIDPSQANRTQRSEP